MHTSTIFALLAFALLSIAIFVIGIAWIDAAMWNHQAHSGIAMQMIGAAGSVLTALAANDLRARR